MKVYAFVPAKGISERIENKNMRILSGERLYARALKTLLACKEIDKVFLDTESQEMYDLVDYLPITYMKRDKNLANNKTDGHQIFINEVNQYPDADIYVQLLCTSPFIRPETIDNSIKVLKENKIYDSAILMKKDKFYFWKDGCPEYDINHIPNSKDLPETIIESMGLYISTKKSALETKRRYGKSPYFVYGDLEELIDVNNPDDLKFAETYAKGKKNIENNRLNLLKHLMSSPALSDLLDDMKIEYGKLCGAIIKNYKCNIPHTKLFGRANTLKLRAINENDDFKDIYKALNSYSEVSENDIIVVENEVNNFAYFGDLNARLAIRSGACGTIVGGATRDIEKVSQLNYPVFYQSINATDVRRRAVLDYINKPIKLDGITISPGDLIFADECAVVVIYQEFEKDVIKKALQIFNVETNVIKDILNNEVIENIINKNGTF